MLRCLKKKIQNSHIGHLRPSRSNWKLTFQVKYMVTEAALTLGGEHTMQYTDEVPQNCALEIYLILLTQ